jgi:hypothetical protein
MDPGKKASFFSVAKAGPTAEAQSYPDILSSLEHLTSKVAPKAILKCSSLWSLANTRWNVCLKSAELKLSPITMWPLEQEMVLK